MSRWSARCGVKPTRMPRRFGPAICSPRQQPPGIAGRVTEPAPAFGAVIGKALTPLVSGQGLVRVLVSPR